MEKTLNVNTENQASEMEQTALKVFYSFIETAKENFNRDGEVAPVVFIGLEDGEKLGMVIMPASNFMQSVEDKDRLSDLMIKVGKSGKAVCIIMITEAWMSRLEGMEKEEAMERYQRLPPSKDPDRLEQLMCTFESENINKSVFFKIVRDPKPGLEDYPMPQGGSVEGRFANVLKDMKKVRDN